MLCREDLCGRHQRRLIARPRGNIHGRLGTDRLTRANVANDDSAHRRYATVLAEHGIAVNIVYYALLRVGQLIGKLLGEWRKRNLFKAHALAALFLRARQRNTEPKGKELVKGEP